MLRKNSIFFIITFLLSACCLSKSSSDFSIADYEATPVKTAQVLKKTENIQTEIEEKDEIENESEPTAQVLITQPKIEKEISKTAKNKIENRTIFFASNSFSLSKKNKSALNEQVVSWMKKNPKIKVIIEGHCDETGTKSYNKKLGEKRAKEVKKYLVKKGISAKRIKTVSYGELRPLDSHHNKEAWAKNRRVVTIKFEKKIAQKKSHSRI